MSDYSKRLSDSYLRGIEAAAEDLGDAQAGEIAEAHVDAGARWFDKARA